MSDLLAQSPSVTTAAATERLSRRLKIVYGSGEWSLASFGTLRQIFYAIFLTDVVGLDPRLASIAALIGITWDALNDPIVGRLSDNLQTRWGRRRPFFLLFAVPFGLAFLLQWWAPPWNSQLALLLTVMFAFMLCDTLQTLLAVPYHSLTAELTDNYDERTRLAGYRMFFNLVASLATAVAAPAIVDAVQADGSTSQGGYLLTGAIFGTLAAIPFLLIFFTVRERAQPAPDSATAPPFAATLRLAWRNIPFRFAAGLYLLNWITFDLVALMFPFFLVYWVAGGDLLASASVFGARLPLESAVLGLLLTTAVITLPLWIWLAARLGKQRAYALGIGFWALIQLLVFLVQPGQVELVLGLAVLAGIGVSAAHVLPDAIFPDVVAWDELRTGQQQTGIYYGLKNFGRKLTGALANFLALQALGWAGYLSPGTGATSFQQSESALLAIRTLIGPGGALLLLAALLVVWRYPLTRERHGRVVHLLERRRQLARKRHTR
ncbi:MAG: MFS transporter [Chloroflexi bacterium]|nr:MFS transporter [Chloroflexota bacterium]